MASRRFLLALLPGLAWIAACAPGEVGTSELDQHLCAHETLGDEFQELVRGNFTPKDLADLSDDADRREGEYRQAGMKRGKFVYFKEVLPRPPFEPPITVVCQVIEFDTDDAAGQWLRGLDATDALESLAFGRVPREDIHEEETPPPTGFGTDSGQVRQFEAAGGAGDERTLAYYLVGSEGRFVRAVSVGRRGGFFDNEAWQSLLYEVWLNRGSR